MEEIIGGHSSYLHRNANKASGEFAPKCNRTLHEDEQNVHMSALQDERDRLRKALVSFYESAHHARAIRSVRAWAVASELSPSTINPVLKGTANKRLDDETYFKLAAGASKLLGRAVSVEELKGDLPKAVVLTDRQRRALAALDRFPEDRQEEEISVLEARVELFERSSKISPQGS